MSNAELVNSILAAYGSLQSSAVAPFFADNCKFQVLPASLKSAERNKEEYLKLVGGIADRLSEVKYDLIDLIDAKEQAVAHVRADGKFKDGSPYVNEYIIIFKLENDKVVSLREFVDSLAVASVKQKLMG